MSRRQYITPRRLQAVREALADTDWQVLNDVAKVRLLSATQLQRLHSVSGLSEVRRFRRHLLRLVELDVLARLERRVGGLRRGSASFVYALGLVGQRLVVNESTRPRAPWTPRPSWLAHALQVSELYVRLKEADNEAALQLVRYDSESDCWRTFTSGYSPQTLKPDAYVETWLGQFEDRYFVEVDRGTESTTTLARKLDVYRHYWQSAAEQQANGIFPKVLWLVPDDFRQRTLVEVAARQPAEAWALHQIVRFDQALATFTETRPAA